MKKVWKYELNDAGENYISMPKGAVLLSAQVQNDKICLWALVDPYADMSEIVVFVIGTGHDVYEDVMRRHISTVQLHGGSLVLHIFEGGWTHD